MSNKNSSFEIKNVPTLALEFAKFMDENKKEFLDTEEKMFDAAMNVATEFDSRLIRFAIHRKTSKIYAVNQAVEKKDFPQKILIGSNFILFDENEFETAKLIANEFKAEMFVYDFSRMLKWSDEEFEFITTGKPNKSLAKKYRDLMLLAKKTAHRFKSTPPNRDNFNHWEKST